MGCIFKELFLGQTTSLESSADHIALDTSDQSDDHGGDQKEDAHLFDRGKLGCDVNVCNDGEACVQFFKGKNLRIDEIQYVISDEGGDNAGNHIGLKIP